MYLGEWHAPQAKDEFVSLGNETVSSNKDIYVTMFTTCKELFNFLHTHWSLEREIANLMSLRSTT
jgi:hypothetical protein